MAQISDETLRDAVHETEPARAILAMVAFAPLVIVGIVASVASLLLLPLLALVILVALDRLVEALLTGNAVEVNDKNFSDISLLVRDVTDKLGYSKSVRVFIVQDGDMNAILWRTFGRRYVSLNSSLVESMTSDELRFVIGRFIGALKVRHLRFHELSVIFDLLGKAKILNVLLLPYLRATVYSGDRIGALVLNESSSALTAMNKLLIGKELCNRISPDGLTAQAKKLRRSPFRTIAILFSTHPHVTDRYLELQNYLAIGKSA